MNEFNATNLVKYNSKVKNLRHANLIIETLQDYANQENITELEARNELFKNGNDIRVIKENGNIPSITEAVAIDANTLQVTYDCFTGIDDVDCINGDFACNYVYDDKIDIEAVSQRFNAIESEYQKHLDNQELEEYGLTRANVDMVVEYTNLDEDEARQLLIKYVDNGYSVDDFEESYCGLHDNDEDFTRQLLEDIGDIPSDMPTYIHIDWTRTANDIMMDYFTIELNGDSYYFRNL